jgi:hypothetical protein
MDAQPPLLTTPPTPGRTRRRWTGAVAALLVAVALVAGIAVYVESQSNNPASPGVAHIGPTPTPSSQSSSQGGLGSPSKDRSSILKYSACMRSHGLPDFPDPNSQGGISISISGAVGGGHGSDLDPNSPRFQAAQRACKSLAPGGNLTPAQQAQMRASALKMSACMRAHGIADFPDPSAQGGIQLRGGPGSDLDPNSPRFQAAQKACMPGGGAQRKDDGGIEVGVGSGR